MFLSFLIVFFFCVFCVCFVQVAPPGKRSEVRDGDVGVALWNVPATNAQQLALGVLLRVCHDVPVHVGRGHGLGPATMVRVHVAFTGRD